MTEAVKYPSAQQIDQMTAVFAQLGDETRLRILTLLHQNPQGLSGKAISEALEQKGGTSSQPSVTFAISKLTDAGLVESHKNGRERISQLVPERREMVAQLIINMAQDLDGKTIDWSEFDKSSKKPRDRSWQDLGKKNNKKVRSKPSESQKHYDGATEVQHRPLTVMGVRTLFPNVKADHSLLYISPNEPTPEEKNLMGGELAFVVTHEKKIPKKHSASVVIIDGRETDKVEVCEMIDAAKKVKDCPVFVIDGGASSNYYLANGASRVFTPEEIPAIGNHAIAAIATHTGTGLSLC